MKSAFTLYFLVLFPLLISEELFAQNTIVDNHNEIISIENKVYRPLDSCEKIEREMCHSATDSICNMVFERYFKKHYKADSCDCIILPESVEIYKYVADKSTSLDSLVYTPNAYYQLVSSFVPVLDVGKRIEYVDVESNRNILTFPIITEIIFRHDGFIVKAQLSSLLAEETFEDFEGNTIETTTIERMTF